MKKLIALLALMLLLSISLVACETSPPNGDGTGTSGTTTTADPSTEENDNNTTEHTHVNVTDPAVAPTCTQTGLTAGAHCETCGEILLVQELVSATGIHTYGEDGICIGCLQEKPAEHLSYTKNTTLDAYTVTGIGTVTALDIVIPAIYNDLPVTGIGDEAFRNCNDLTSITIPDSVTHISKSAFSNCLAVIQTENGVSYVDKWVIGCDTSSASVVLRDNTVGIANFAFENCGELTSVTIGNHVRTIGENAFQGCSRLTDVTIPASITSIGKNAFSGCTTAIETENGVSYVDKWIIACDTSLLQVTLRTDTVGIADSAFRGCELMSIQLPYSVAIIGNYAFYNCLLTNLTLSGSVKIIGNSAFEDSTGLEMLVIGNGVEVIGNRAFYSCESLTRLTMGSNVKSIGRDAFNGCNLNDITLPDSVVRIGKNAFNGVMGTLETGSAISYVDKWVKGFMQITFDYHESAKYAVLRNDTVGIGDFALEDCEKLISIKIPKSVTIIGDCAFKNCSKLTDITFAGTMAEWEAITKGHNWDIGTDDYTIHCTDGDITKS